LNIGLEENAQVAIIAIQVTTHSTTTSTVVLTIQSPLGESFVFYIPMVKSVGTSNLTAHIALKFI
jgi:hypothetical protein